MADFRAKYKQKGLSFGDLERSRISRAEKRDEQRKEIRTQNFSRLRPLVEAAKAQSPGKSTAKTSRNERLQKWKQEKEMRKKTEKKVAKPPFKVGVVHHRVFSPPHNNSAGPSCSHLGVRSRVQHQTAPLKGITRVTEKRLAAKAAARAAAEAAEKKSFAPANYKFKAPVGLPNIPLFGRVKKGSIDATKLSWNLNDITATVKSEPRNSLASQRKKSNSLTRESSRRSKKFKNSFKEDESTTSNTHMEVETHLSSSRKSLASDSSIDSISLRVSSDDTQVFDSPVTEKSCINIEMHKKESTLKETPVTSAQPAKINQASPPKDKEELTSKLPLFSVASEKVLHSSLTEKEGSIPSETDMVSDLTMNSLQSQEKDPPDQVEIKSLQMADEAPEILLGSEPEKMDTSSSEFAEKPLNDSLNLAFFSPYVVTRRGKREARKEQQIRRGFSQFPEEIPTKETIMQSLNISIEEEKRTSQYFKYLLESETNRLTEQCDLWNNIVISENPPEEAKSIVEQAIGQTRLLLKSKFKQFAGLVLQCEEGAGEQLVTCKDLQGFWDMMSMTIKNCESRFQKVEELKARGWKEEDEMEKMELRKVPTKKISHLKKKSPAKKKSPSKKVPAKSSLRAMILAARQKKKEMEENLEAKPTNQEIMEIFNNDVKDSPTKIVSSKRKSSITPQHTTPKERRTSFPFAAVAISQKYKIPEDKAPESKITLETQHEAETEIETEIDTGMDVEIINVQVHLDESISYINSKQTPGKSILKRVKLESSSDASDDSRLAKSTHKVNFNENVELNEVEVEEEAKTKASLAAALARIDSTEFDREYIPEVRIRAEKKLNFEDESFNETVNSSLIENGVFDDEQTPYETLMIPEFNVIPPTPKSPRLSKKSKTASDLENFILEEAIVEEEEVTFTKSLRNRTIVGNLTPRSKMKMNKENDSGSVKYENSPRVRKDKSFHREEESTNISEKQPAENHSQDDSKMDGLDLSGTLSHSLRSSKNTQKFSRLHAKSPRQAKPKKAAPKSPNLTQEKVEEALRRRSPRQEEETKGSKKQERSGDQKENSSPVMKFARMAVHRTSLLYKLMKSPKSATKKAKEISKALEDIQVESDVESKPSDSPAKVNCKILSKMGKTPKGSQVQKENETKVEEQIYEEFQKMQLDESNLTMTEKPSVLAKLFATPHDLSQTKSPRQRRKSAKNANKSSLEESMEVESSTSNVETLSTVNKMLVDDEEETENSAKENVVDSLEVENNLLKRRNSRKHRSNGNVLNVKDTNHKDLKGLNSSMQESKITKSRTPRRSLRIPENKRLFEKENATPEKFKNKTLRKQYSINVLESLKTSPRSNDTLVKRKSIKRSMSCHVEECKMAFASMPQFHRSKSSGLVKTPNGRRTMNLMSFDAP